MTRRCRDCRRQVRGGGRPTWLGWCDDCRAAHRCAACGTVYRRRLRGMCRFCVQAMRLARMSRLSWAGAESHVRPPGWEEHLERLSERARRRLPLCG